jgi:hypothetical protein
MSKSGPAQADSEACKPVIADSDSCKSVMGILGAGISPSLPTLKCVCNWFFMEELKQQSLQLPN